MFQFVFLLNLFVIYIPLLIIGYFMPNFIRNTLIFGIVIPEEVSSTKEVIELKKVYKRNYSLSAITTTILLNAIAIYTGNENVLNGGILLLIVIMTVNYLYVHNKAKALKQEKGWTVNKKQMVVVDTSHSYNKNFPSVYWFWFPVSIFIFTLLFTMIQYPHLPDQIPTHFDLAGNITSYRNKGFFSVFGLPLTQVGMTTLFYFIYRMLRGVRSTINAARPKTSALQNKIAKRYWALYLLVTLAVMNLQFLYIQLNVLQVMNLVGVGNLLIHAIALIIPMAGVIWVSIKTGQSGSRIKIDTVEETDSKVIDRDDDQFWKWGMIYYNPQDASLFIEKRFGIGWTINFANPGGKVIMIVTVIAIAASLLIPRL